MFDQFAALHLLRSTLYSAVFAALLAGSAAAAEPTRARDHEVIWRSWRLCGVNCLYGLLRARGVASEYGELVSELASDDELISLVALREAAAKRGLTHYAIGRATREGLAIAEKPAIAHVEPLSGSGKKLQHYVLVLDANAEHVTYLDGSSAQIRRTPWHRFEREWSGYILYDAGRVPDRPLFLTTGALMLVLGTVVLRRAFRRLP